MLEILLAYYTTYHLKCQEKGLKLMLSSIRFAPRTNNTNLAENELPKAIPVPTSQSDIKIAPTPKAKRPRRNLVARVSVRSEDHSADAFMERADINNLIRSLLVNSKSSSKRRFTKACAFIFTINTGYRAGDGLSLRVKDVLDGNGEIVDELCLSEDKTDKSRVVYFNKAVKIAIRFLIDVNHLTSENYLFVGEGNRTSYLDHIEYDENGNIEKIVSTGEKIKPDGTIREACPYWVGSLSRIIIQEAKKLNIEGHYSSHCMRKTFAEFISRNWIDERNPMIASKALNHAEVRTTVEYYMRVDPRKLKNQWLNLNLGLEALETFINAYNNGEYQYV